MSFRRTAAGLLVLTAALSAGWTIAGWSACRPGGVPSQPAAPQPAPAASPASAPDAALAEEAARLGDRWLRELGDGWAAAVQPPFVVVLAGPQRSAQAWLEGTILPAAERLQKQFMKARPDKPVVVLLFPDHRSYVSACRNVLGLDDPPYYGFYRLWERMLVMDISTGGGTLVHELTHAMIAFDFPDIPDWFNEGLASLYEQCNYDRDRLRGLTNWRLAGLQQAVRDKRLGSLADLTRIDFRGDGASLNYAQARYLCLYMQDRGLLEPFYRDFRDGYEDDPTGLKFLRAVFAPKSLDQADTEWRAWVMKLRFP